MTTMSILLTPVSSSSSSPLQSPCSSDLPSVFPSCSCRYHMTREHLWSKSTWIQGKEVFTIANPYYVPPKIETRGRPRKTVMVKEDKINSPTFSTPHLMGSQRTSSRGRRKLENPTYFFPSPSPSPSPPPPKRSTALPPRLCTKYEIWQTIKAKFNEYKRLGGTSIRSRESTAKQKPTKLGSYCDHSCSGPSKGLPSPPVKKCKWESPFNKFPFRAPPGSVNGETIFTMPNPFANKMYPDIPIDELTRLFLQNIDREPERVATSFGLKGTSLIEAMPITSPSLSSCYSPQSTTSLPPPPSHVTESFIELDKSVSSHSIKQEPLSQPSESTHSLEPEMDQDLLNACLSTTDNSNLSSGPNDILIASFPPISTLSFENLLHDEFNADDFEELLSSFQDTL